MTQHSPVVDEFDKQVTNAVETIEMYGTREEAITCMTKLDNLRRRLDRLTLDPTRR